jgi:hypothetical protein
MTYTYDILKEEHGVTDTTSPSVLQTAPSWAIVIFPYKNQLSVDKTLFGDPKTHLVSNTQDSLETLPPIIIQSDCIQLTCNNNKTSKADSFSAILEPSRDYIRLIHPGDWCMVWMANDEQTIKDTIDTIQGTNGNKVRVNNFKSGLKFVGKVWGVDKNLSVNSDGVRKTSYKLNGYGFTEFNNEILYFKEIEQQLNNPQLDWMLKFGETFNSQYISTGAHLDTNKLVPALISAILGSAQHSRGTAHHKWIVNAGYKIPSIISHLLIPIDSKYDNVSFSADSESYMSILHGIIGTQKYDSTENGPNSLFPSNADVNPLYFNFFQCDTPVTGLFPYQDIVVDRKPLWSFLQEYSNPSVNEMITTLRANKDGNIFPHFILRQLPFNTDFFKPTSEKYYFTKFSTLPRWKIDDALIYDVNVGTTNELRFNSINIMPMKPAQSTSVENPVYRWMKSNPKYDIQDIVRAGLHTNIRSVSCRLDEAETDRAGQWNAAMGEFQFGLHLSLNGSIGMVGVQSPICVGDNAEYNDVVYHIESINHACGINSGKKFFHTTLALSHGVAKIYTNQNDMYPSLLPEITDTSITSIDR